MPSYSCKLHFASALVNKSTSIDIASSKAVHSLVNSIMLVNINKGNAGERVQIPALPGIKQPQQIAICPRMQQSSVMLSKVLIKDHLHKEQIIDLAKEIHTGEPKHLRQGKNIRNYLIQAKTMFEVSLENRSASTVPARPQSKSSPFGATMPKVTFVQSIKGSKLYSEAVFPPKLGPTNIPVAPKLKEDWQTVQWKKATHQGTKSTMVSGIMPVTHQIPHAMLLSVNDKALTRHFFGILELVPGTEELLANNLLKHAHWSLNRDILHATFASPIDDNLRAMMHHAFRKFFNVSDDSEPTFIEHPTISSIKWASVPCFNADNKEISEHQLADQILQDRKSVV